MNADPALLRGLTQRRLWTRRDALRLSGASAAALALSACGVRGAGTAADNSTAEAVERFWAGKTRNGHVDFANWPLYMDPKHPELAAFTKETGITVTYKEVVQDMPSWFAKIQPQLSARQSIGYDLMVITNGTEFSQLVNMGLLAPLDPARLVNFRVRASAHYRTEFFDPGNVYSVAWASGMTGIAYNPDRVDRPSSLLDLWNPRYKGKVGMMSDPSELGNFGMLAVGVTPESSTPADWQRAADKLSEQKATGVVRAYYGQDYIDALGKGDIWLAQAWSGDIFQKNATDGTNLQFIIPEEGGTLWTDNMTIPITAANPVDAITLMDFFYRVDVAASLAEYITYITPVPEARDVIESDAKAAAGTTRARLQTLAGSPLIFPSQADYARLHYFRAFTSTAEQDRYDRVFQAVTNS
jgi:spermidine/putrescine transport system substrate-binding protein